MNDTTDPGWLDNLSSAINNPLVSGLMGMAQGFGQAAMPSRMPIPFGAALGLAAGGMQSGMRNAYMTQLAQEQAKTAHLQNQFAANQLGLWQQLNPNASVTSSSPLGVPNAGGLVGAGGTAPAVPAGPSTSDALISPQYAAMMARILSANPQSARAVGPWLDYLRNFAPSGGGSMVTSAGVVPTPGALPAISATEYAKKAPEAAIDVQKAWQMLAPEAQKALTAAGIDVNKAWQMPQSYMPGATVGSPQQIQAGNLPPDPFPSVAQRISAVEGQGANPASTATGTGQFLAGTFPAVIRAVRPDLAAGKTDQQLLALRSVPGLGMAATEQYARQNGVALAQGGQPITPSTLYMAHLLGPAGAASVLRASDQTPLSAILPAEVISKNPILQGKTAGAFRSYADQTMQGAVAPTQGKPAQVPTSPQITEAEEEGKTLAKLPETINATAREGQNALLRLEQVKQAVAKATAGGVPPGYFSPELAQAAAAAKSLGIDLKPLGIDPTAVPNQQAAQEALVQINGEILKRLFPQRITNMDIKLYSGSLAHYGMDPAALNQVLGLAEAQAKYDVDTGKSMNQWKADNKGSLVGWREHHYLNEGYGPDVMEALRANATPSPEPRPEAPPGAAQRFTLAHPAMPKTAGDLEKLKPGDVYINPADGKPLTYKGTGNAARP